MADIDVILTVMAQTPRVPFLHEAQEPDLYAVALIVVKAPVHPRHHQTWVAQPMKSMK